MKCREQAEIDVETIDCGVYCTRQLDEQRCMHNREKKEVGMLDDRHGKRGGCLLDTAAAEVGCLQGRRTWRWSGILSGRRGGRSEHGGILTGWLGRDGTSRGWDLVGDGGRKEGERGMGAGSGGWKGGERKTGEGQSGWGRMAGKEGKMGRRERIWRKAEKLEQGGRESCWEG